MAFFLKLEHLGADLYPKLREYHASGASPGRAHSGGVTLPDAVRYEVMRRTGHFVTESSEHFSEYVPWFIKRDRPDLIERFGNPDQRIPTALRGADRRLGTVTGNREHVYHAAMLDPHTAAELDLDQIWAMVDEMLDAHGDLIPPALRRYAGGVPDPQT